jgi:7-cyano-7-deazaguanine synthase
MKAISLLSGGLDSSVATAVAVRGFEVELAVTFDYGQRAAAREIDSSRLLCRHLKIRHSVIKLPWLAKATRTALVDKKNGLPETAPHLLEEGASERAAKVWVPNRNGVFVAIAAALAEAKGCEVVVAGFNSEEAATFPDNSKEFIEASNCALGFSTLKKIKLESPTACMTKEGIASHFITLGLPTKALWCCYDGKKKLCGVCESCSRTIRAFSKIDSLKVIEKNFLRCI